MSYKAIRGAQTPNINNLWTSYCVIGCLLVITSAVFLSRFVIWLVAVVFSCFPLFALFVYLKFSCPLSLLFSLCHWAQKCFIVVYLNRGMTGHFSYRHSDKWGGLCIVIITELYCGFLGLPLSGGYCHNHTNSGTSPNQAQPHCKPVSHSWTHMHFSDPGLHSILLTVRFPITPLAHQPCNTLRSHAPF